MDEEPKKKSKGYVIIATPFMHRPTDPYLESLEASIPVLDEAGWKHGVVHEAGNCYVSNARANLMRKALNGEPDMIVYIDYDMSWEPESLLRLIETRGDVIAGTYRFKKKEVEYMGRAAEINGRIICRDDGCIKMLHVPAGFLKITRPAINKIIKAYPELTYGEPCYPYFDLFNHGVRKWFHDGEERSTWFGEDYAFAQRWCEISNGDLWCQPNLTLTHNHREPDGTEHKFVGNYHEYLCAQPGASNDPARLKAQEALKEVDLEALLTPEGIANLLANKKEV